MDEIKQIKAISFCVEALLNFEESSEIAKYVKKKLDKFYGKYWTCIVRNDNIDVYTHYENYNFLSF